jgi:hypothetical protein
MGIHYTSYCDKCKLAIEDGKDSYRIRHELFKLYHNYRYKDHKVERYDDDQWIDKWLNDEENEPKELYDEKLGYLISIPQWLEEIIEKETKLWIKNEHNVYENTHITEEDVIRRTIELNQDKLLTKCLNEFEYRLKRVLTINEQYAKLRTRNIELVPNQRLIILTNHGTFYIDDIMDYVNLFAVRDGERVWIVRLEDDKILKYGIENNPTDEATITDVELVEEIKRRGIKIEIPGNDNRSDFCQSERPRCYACGTICTPVTKIKIGGITFDIEEDKT